MKTVKIKRSRLRQAVKKIMMQRKVPPVVKRAAPQDRQTQIYSIMTQLIYDMVGSIRKQLGGLDKKRGSYILRQVKDIVTDAIGDYFQRQAGPPQMHKQL